jgi:cellulose biosynthesis protein BcsQ
MLTALVDLPLLFAKKGSNCMRIIAFWNNKGGTGKTSLAFQTICAFAQKHGNKKILAVDACPQANLSELLLGGLEGSGSQNLLSLQSKDPRQSIAGYFQKRLPSPYTMPQGIAPQDFICNPLNFNKSIAPNIDLMAGDALLELQANAIATLSNTQIPGTNTWLAVIDWLADYLKLLGNSYDVIFIDTNPSFSIYTQIALATATQVVLPVMPDDSSRRAIQNAFSLIYGINLPSSIYAQYSFTTKLSEAKRVLPQVHLVVKNRLTQYMGPASAYSSVLKSIDGMLAALLKAYPQIFTFSTLADGIVDVRDFQTTGVVAFAEGQPFIRVRSGNHVIQGRTVQVNQEMVQYCSDAISGIVNKL